MANLRRILAALGVAVMLAACQPTPTATITASSPRNPVCYNLTFVEGKVTPAGATPRVVLQRTVNGKWVDWQWYDEYRYDEKPTRLVAVPNATTGAYRIKFRAPSWANVTVHLRVRSDDNTSFSPSFYITSYQIPTEPTCV